MAFEMQINIEAIDIADEIGRHPSAMSRDESCNVGRTFGAALDLGQVSETDESAEKLNRKHGDKFPLCFRGP